jgi:O-antigen/teichoic acid export membrane protein
MVEVNKMRRLSVEGTVFFLIVNAVANIPLVYFPGSPSFLILTGIAFTIIDFVVAYFCWKLKPWSFIIAIILALFIITSTITISGLRYPGDEFLVILQSLITFFSFRGYREVKEK